MQKKNEDSGLFLFVISAIVGLGFIIAGIIALVDNWDFRRTFVEKAAVITEIKYSTLNDRRTVYVAFSVDGKDYEGPISHWSAGMQRGQYVTIYYDLNDPQYFQSLGLLENFLPIIGGMVFFLPGIIAIQRHRKRMNP